MKVFLPFQKEGNPYLEEIAFYSNCEFIYGDLDTYSPDFDIVNIHWPEAIFHWLEPSKEELEILQEHIRKWKVNSILVYTKHDFKRLKGLTPNFKTLFDLIEKNTDVFIHLGEHSRKFYTGKFPEARHEIIVHPLYRNFFNYRSKAEARRELGISNDALVIIAPGQIRLHKERDMVLQAFRDISIDNKVLIATTMRSEIRYDFPGRVRLKKFIDIRNVLVEKFKKKYRPPKYFFNYERLNYEQFGLRMAAADIVLIPRIEILNSGNVFLGLTYGKILVGPKTGNIYDQITELGFPVFEGTKRRSVINALLQAIKLKNENFKINESLLNKYEPQNVAKELDSLFYSLVRSNED